jgi:hypothetical protein
MQQRVYKNFLFVWLLAFASITVQAQEIDVILNTAETKYMQEKIYLQTDKTSYNSGETVWFKAYLTADNLPAPMSKTVYAELLNEKGMVLQRKMMPVILAGAASDFILPDSLPDSRLFVRAYTSWMLNFDSSLLCVKPIHIIPKKITAKKAAASTYSISFFPEGGDLVEKVLSHVAFKATDQDGTPIAVKGDIVNNDNKTVSSFAAVHDGMGSFVLAPLPGEKYKAIWKDKNGVRHESVLPAAKKDGVVLSIGFPDNALHYSLNRPDSVSPEYLKFTVVAQSQQRLMYSAQINLSKKTTVTAPMITDSMPDGVLQITVFNALMEPVAERLVFVNNNAYSFITDLHLIEQNIIKHGRNVIQLDVGGSLLTNLSVSVTDADVIPVGKNESNIYSELLLSSDLKGSVYNPAYYFSGDADSVKQHLDLVMMTNGWRRFKWEKLLANEWPVLTYLPDNYLTIQGRVLGLSRTLLYNKAISGILKTKNNPASFLNIPISEQGNFSQGSMYFFDTAKLYYQLSNDKDKTITNTASFSFTNTFIKAPVLNKALLNNLYLPDRTDSSALVKSSSLANLRRNQQLAAARVETLQEVKVISKQKSLKQKLDEEYTSGFFSGGDGYTFTTEDDPFAKSAQGVLQYLQGKVAGLQISTNGIGSATWRGSATSFFLNENPTDLSMLQSINMNDVAMIKVFRPPFFGATGGGSGGAIAIYTKKGSSTNNDFKGLPFANIYGYSAIREFYSPDYTVNDPNIKDYRTTLYWNPHVHIDKNSRRIVLPFFNSDNCKKMRVIIEGINELGLLTREEKIFE